MTQTPQVIVRNHNFINRCSEIYKHDAIDINRQIQNEFNLKKTVTKDNATIITNNYYQYIKAIF